MNSNNAKLHLHKTSCAAGKKKGFSGDENHLWKNYRFAKWMKERDDVPREVKAYCKNVLNSLGDNFKEFEEEEEIMSDDEDYDEEPLDSSSEEETDD